MRRMKLISACALLFCLGICLATRIGVHKIVHRGRHLRTQAIDRMDAGEIQAAEETMVQLAQYFKDKQGFLEIVCEHEDLHQIKEQIIDAQASIEFGSKEDFYQAIYRFGERLEHIADIESLRLSNFY